MAKAMEVGDRVYVADRKHPEKKGWLQCNGQVIEIIMNSDDPDDDPEPYEIVVGFSDNDVDTYFVEQFEWTDSLGGYWNFI